MFHSLLPSLAAFLAALGLMPGVIVVQDSGAGPVTQVFLGGNNVDLSTLTDGVSVYSVPTAFSNLTPTTTQASHEVIFLQGTLSELRARTNQDIGADASELTLVLSRCNSSGCGVALICTITGVSPGTNCLDTGSFSIAAGERLTMELTRSGTLAASTIVGWSFKWVGTNPNESMLFASYNADGASTNEIAALDGGSGQNSGSTATLTQVSIPAPENFTITGIWARNATPLGSTCHHLQVRHNSLNNAGLQVGLTGTNDSSVLGPTPTPLNVVTSPTTPDYLSIFDDPGATGCQTTGTATTSRIAVTLRITQAQQRFVTGICSGLGGSAPDATNPYYTYPSGQATAWSATEAAKQMVTNGFIQHGFAYRSATDPDTDTNNQFVVYDLKNASASGVGCIVTEGTTMCGGSSPATTFNDGDLMTLRSVPTGTPLMTTQWCAAWSGKGT